MTHALDDHWADGRALVARAIANGQEGALRVDVAKRIRSSTDPLVQARLHRIAALLDPPDADVTPEWVSSIAQAVAMEVQPLEPRPAAMPIGEQSIARAPARVDFAGGWSDTPPICSELGGCVVNGSVRIGGIAPIHATAQLLDARRIRLVSVDLGESTELTDDLSTRGYDDPTCWTSLPKAALVLSGVLAPGEESLEESLARLGGGLELRFGSGLPHGSGLGTSSILGAVILCALTRLTGRRDDMDMLIRLTCMLEQLMSTGGGWQDQVGGLYPGLKRITTEPGRIQVPQVTMLPRPSSFDAEFEQRAVMINTRMRRMARGILRGVVGRYLERDPQLLSVIDELKADAIAMGRAIEGGAVDEFATLAHAYGRHKAAIDPAAMNDQIADLVRPCADLLSCSMLPGAGGGGFVFMIAKDQGAAQRVRQMFADRVVPHALDDVGLV